MPIRIFIDQGHNPQGVNAGAEGFGLRERMSTTPWAWSWPGSSTATPGLWPGSPAPRPQRAWAPATPPACSGGWQMANSWPADYFVSIHCNANTNPAVNGTEVYVYQQRTQAYWLAQHVLNGVVEAVGTKDNGVRLNPSLYVLRRTAMPAILVELATSPTATMP